MDRREDFLIELPIMLGPRPRAYWHKVQCHCSGADRTKPLSGVCPPGTLSPDTDAISRLAWRTGLGGFFIGIIAFLQVSFIVILSLL